MDGAINHNGRSEMVLLDGTLNPQMLHQGGLSTIVCIHGWRFWTKFCPGQCHARHSMWHGYFSGAKGCGGHGLAKLESRHQPHGVRLRLNGDLDPRHGWPPFHWARIVALSHDSIKNMIICHLVSFDDAKIVINSGSQTYHNCFLTTDFYLTDQKFEKINPKKEYSGIQRIGDATIIAINVVSVVTRWWIIASL